MEMFRTVGTLQAVSKDEHWYEWAVLDYRMCLYFFQYLNFDRLGKERFQQVAINNMIDVIRAEPKIPHRETGLNLVGYSFMREEQLRNSFTCFFISLKIRPHNNAAKFFLAILFRKVNCTRGKVTKTD
ncbi:hypothetical protein ACJMK2_040070 [Sinanodonta woodiana]|uniref:Uncharacterized protein n=1 Tax=Sinanodonta woodiana TaxID=1069815 RepID=A0ABD3WFV2_SINWO